MRIYTFLNDTHEVIAVVKAQNYKKSLKKAKNFGINEKTPYFSEPVEECLYYTY
jgi:hypothetical protein